MASRAGGNDGDWRVIDEHVARYEFARDYSKEHQIRSAADIASGTCYGMEILKQAVAEVDGYDKKDFCSNYVVDLEKQGWAKQYDLIVSFETIEHLANPDFFLRNAARSAPLLIISTPVNEPAGKNIFHKQRWTPGEFRALLVPLYSCDFLYQSGAEISKSVEPQYYILGVCRRRQ